MSDREKQEPAGLGVHNKGPAAEYAREQGWGTDEEQRTRPPETAPSVTGGTDFNYGPQDFGDTPVNEGNVEPAPESIEFLTGQKDRKS